MVNAQEWLFRKYPNKENVTKIKREHFTKIIEGELVIDNFPNLKKIDVSVFRQGKLTKLKIINCPQLRKLNCENNQLEELIIDDVSRQNLQKLNYQRNNSELKFDWKNASELVTSNTLDSSDDEQEENNSEGWNEENESEEKQTKNESLGREEEDNKLADTQKLSEIQTENNLEENLIEASNKGEIQAIVTLEEKKLSEKSETKVPPQKELKTSESSNNLEGQEEYITSNSESEESSKINAFCDQCEKEIGERNLTWFSDTEKGLGFCSKDCYLKWNSNWREIYEICLDFTENLQKEWEDWNFSPEEVKEWIAVGLTSQEFELASFLYKKLEEEVGDGNVEPKSLSKDDLERLRKEYIGNLGKWKSINSDFDYSLQLDWENEDLDYEQTKKWAKALDDKFEVYGYEFCAWLRDEKGLTAEDLVYDELDKLIDEYNEEVSDNEYWNNVQEYLNSNCPDKENTKEIKFDSDELELSEQGALVISDYPNLEGIYALGQNNTKNITKVTISNCPKLKEININNFVDNEKLEINNCANLEILRCGNNNLTKLNLGKSEKLIEIYCYDNKLTNLNLSNCPNLTILECWINQLSNLDLTNCEKLTEIGCQQNKLNQLILPKLDNLQKLICWNNNLTNLDFLNNCNSEKLEMISLGSNNFPKEKYDLTIFTKFKELKLLGIAGIDKPSYFEGSLEPLKNLEKLESLQISGTDITHGLEYLPKSIKNFYCDPCRSESKVNDIYEELQPFGGDIQKWREVKLEKKDYLSLAPLMPADLRNNNTELNAEEKKELENKLESDYRLAELFKKLSLQQIENKETKQELNWNLIPNYTVLHFNQWKLTKPLLPQESPLRLYDFQADKIYFNLNKEADNKNNEPTKDLNQPYAILSYVWGERDSEAMKTSLVKRDQGNKTTSNSASKSIEKAKKALTIINTELSKNNYPLINYLWVDQLCMNQEDQHEKSEEVPKMGKYYDNSTLTLIAMDSKIGEISEIMKVLKRVVNSDWFERSWTYQEGWLSKHTLFMFDDKLIDGYAMAGYWVLNQPSYVNTGKYLSWYEFNQGTKKIATPVGWVYYRHGYNQETDKVELTLTQALYAIKNRKRTEPLDGIYSILGLLPYGKEVKVSYSNNTPEQALKEVMEIAIKNDYAEPLSWLGISNSKQGLCWMPEINKEGSTSIMGSMGKVNSTKKALVWTNSKDTNLISLTNQGLDFTWIMPHYIIHKDKKETIHKLESGFEIEGGLYRKDIEVKPRDTASEPIKLSLLGTKESLEQATENNILVVLDKEDFGTNKLLALLVKNNQTKLYHRLGLVELVDSEGIKFILGNQAWKKSTIIGSTEYQTQIEIPPK